MKEASYQHHICATPLDKDFGNLPPKEKRKTCIPEKNTYLCIYIENGQR